MTCSYLWSFCQFLVGFWEFHSQGPAPVSPSKATLTFPELTLSTNMVSRKDLGVGTLVLGAAFH